MNANNIYKTIARLLFGMLAGAMLTPASALTITPSQKPLYIGLSRALPNIMLMVDNSGSMSTNVTTAAHTPSDMPANYNYSCSSAVFGGAATAVEATTIVNMVVDASGVPRFCTNSICSTSSAFSLLKCFDNTKYYNVKYYRGDGSLNTVYLGLNLNWYFKSGIFKKGTLLWGATTKTRIAIAKEAATTLVNSLVPDSDSNASVRLGLATYKDPTGGQILSDMGTLTASYAEDINAQIATLTPSGYTPLAETLADIGRYFSDGGGAYTGNLTLHPGMSNETSASLDAIYNNGASPSTPHSILNSTDHGTLSVAVEDYCQKNFAILVSDGLPNKDREISPLLRDYSGDCASGLCSATPSLESSSNLPGSSTPITATGNSCGTFLQCQNGVKVGRKYETIGSDYLDDVAQALYEMDLRPNLIKPSTSYKNNLVTYAIGFADPSLTEDLNGNGLLDPGEDINGNGKLDNDSVLKDAAVRGGGKFYFANNLGELTDSFNSILSDISSKVGSSSSVAANSTKLGNDTAIYQAKFDSSDWTGSFTALPLGSTEDVNGNGILDAGEDTNGNGKLDAGIFNDKSWEAADNIQAFASRKIVTYNPGSSSKGVLFECANLSSKQKTLLGISDCLSSSDQGVWRLNYLRGDFTHEQKNPLRKASDPNPDPRPAGGIFRNRTRFDNTTGYALLPDPWLLGDIVNSDPVYVSAENYGYDKLPATEPEKTSYKTFVNFNKTRQNMVYVGANDGMLHGYDANLVSANAGDELLAYIPDAVYSQLKDFSLPGYVHRYSVDGSPRVGDVYFKTGCSDDSATPVNECWRTVLINTTGAGGKAVFALDITDPENFSATDVLWEVSDTTSPADPDCTTANSDCTMDTSALRGFKNNMGYTLPQPSIGKLHDGSWAAIVANGYGSINNLAVLYLIDIKTGNIIKTLDTAAGDSDHPNGLSTPIAVDTNSDRVVDVIYAGDLLGNLWKFDVSSSSANAWTIANGGSPLFVACSNALACDTTRQPITAKPQVGKTGNTKQPKQGNMVYFGTGKYFEDSDIILTDAQTQTLYGIWDNGATVARSDLQQQSIITELTSGIYHARVTSDNSVNYPTNKGWYMDLLKPSATSSDGERSISTPLMRGDNIIFTTLVPTPPKTSDTCGSGSDGVSWLMEMNAITGGRVTYTGSASGTTGPFDLNGDGIIDSHDLADTNGDGIGDASIGGIQSNSGIIDSPTVVTVNKKVELLIASGIDAEAEKFVGTAVPTNSSGTLGRQSWQQLNLN